MHWYVTNASKSVYYLGSNFIYRGVLSNHLVTVDYYGDKSNLETLGSPVIEETNADMNSVATFNGVVFNSAGIFKLCAFMPATGYANEVGLVRVSSTDEDQDWEVRASEHGAEAGAIALAVPSLLF